jgi:hypothetical protein
MLGTTTVLDAQQQPQITQAMLSQPHSNRGFSQLEYGSIHGFGATGAPPPQHRHQVRSDYSVGAQWPSRSGRFPHI